MLKTLIVGTYLNRRGEAVLTRTYNQCFGSKIRKLGIPLQTSVVPYKRGVKGVFNKLICLRNVF